MTNAEKKAVGERLVSRYNARIHEISQLQQEQEYLKLMGEGLIAAAEGGAESDKQLAAVERERDAVKKELSELEAALPKVRERMTAARAEERKETAEREDRITALDVTIAQRQAKLSALESAINEKANQLGNLIARELT